MFFRLLSADFTFDLLLLFLMGKVSVEQLYFITIRASAVVLDSPKAPVVLSEVGMLASLEQLEPIGLIFLTASVLGLQTPSITRLSCHFLHPYNTFTSATLEMRLVGAACPGYGVRGW